MAVDRGMTALPNGSRLSCGRNAHGRKAAERKERLGARQRNSSLLASARQLQAHVRLHPLTHVPFSTIPRPQQYWVLCMHALLSLKMAPATSRRSEPKRSRIINRSGSSASD